MGVLFAEAVGAFVLEIPPTEDPASLFPGLPCRVIGRVTRERALAFHREGQTITVPLHDLVKAWEGTFAEILF